MNMKELCTSLLAANHAHLARDLKAAEKEGIKRFHIDVTDGHYTENLTFGVQLVRDLRAETSSTLDVHLAVHNMPAILETFLDTGADQITIQAESCDLPQRMLGTIRKAGLASAVSFIPATSFDQIEYFLDEAEVINILAVDPGIGGQVFMTKVLRKIEQCASAIARRSLPTRISVDGGLNRDTCRSSVDAGADILILGSGIFAGSIGENIQMLRQACLS